MKKLFIFLVLTGIVAYFLIPWNELPLTNPQTSFSLAPTAVRPTAVPTTRPTVLPTATLQPTYTPRPTYTPQATYTPVPTPNQIGELREGGALDQFMDVWFARIMAVASFIGIILLIKLFVAIRESDAERDHELNVLELKLQIKQTEPPPGRPIIVKTRGGQSDSIISPHGKEIKKSLIHDFIANYREVGLYVTRWKERENWRQQDIEAVLDWLEHLDYVTPRIPGTACEWKNAYSARQLQKEFGIE